MTDPTQIRWSPAQHYDAANDALASDAWNCENQAQTVVLLAMTHALLGILRRLDEYTP